MDRDDILIFIDIFLSGESEDILLIVVNIFDMFLFEFYEKVEEKYIAKITPKLISLLKYYLNLLRKSFIKLKLDQRQIY